MSIEPFLFANPIYIEAPASLIGWLGWLVILASVAIFLRKWWGYNKKRWTLTQWGILLFLIILLPVTNLFVVLRLPAGEALPPLGKPIEPVGPAMVVFAALPWALAAGWLGPAAAAILAALSGLALSLWDTHSLFTPLEFAVLGLCFSALLNQRYRTLFYKVLRHPLASALLLAIGYPLLFLVDTVLTAQGSLVSRLDYAFTHVVYAVLAVGGTLFIGGLFAEVAALILPALWGNHSPLEPSPAERKLETRFLHSITPLAAVLLLLLMIGDWLVAGNSAREMIRERMDSTAKVASDTLPFFFDSGQSLILQLARDTRLYTEPIERLPQVLGQDLRSVPFFNQLFFLDQDGHSVAGYPVGNYLNSSPSPEELMGVQYSLHGVPIQYYTIPPEEGKTTARVTFIAAVVDDQSQVRGVLVGRSDLESNLMTQPILLAIRTTVGSDGEGMLIDANGHILFSADPALVMEDYTGRVADSTLFYDEIAPDGTRRLIFFQPIRGHPWSVVLAIPARRAQQMALNIAVPLLGMILLLFLSATVLLRLGLRVVTVSLKNLGIEVNRISGGELDHPLSVGGEDEIGQLRRAFERMRLSLKARLDELNRLLVVSQGVASSLEISEAIKPVLEAALAMGASSARIVLAPVATTDIKTDLSAPTHFGSGPSGELYSTLDEQILSLTRKQERIVVNNFARVRLVTITSGTPRPEAILALALRHENLYYGALWMAYDRPHQFTEDEIRFMVTVAGQAALAAANAQLFQSAEVGRQRLAAILASTPDPVLVTDQQNCLLLSNPAAWQVLGTETSDGKAIEQVIEQKELLKLLSISAEDKQSAEIALVNGRVYLATASSVQSDGQREGRVCVLRDITHFKELDALKSEFVATVSHDLRSPLTLMRGYATMLEMVGELNEQQINYMKKIVIAVESMSHLVNNLLDLGRIEAGIDLQLEMVLVQDVVERVTGSLKMQAMQKHVQLEVDIPSQTAPLIEADQALLHQALYNLVENAIKYTNGGGMINVSVRVRQDNLVFGVNDTGIGIAPVDTPRLFEKFYRGVQREAKKQPGTGLGLAIVKSIAERHNGKVWVESQLGKGSTFYLMVPIRQPQQADKALKPVP